jgi:hypothetical protein
MIIASVTDVAIVTSLAVGGVLMTPLAPVLVAMLFVATLGFAVVMDAIKIAVLARVRID